MNDFNTNLKLKTKEVEDIIYNYFPKEEGKQKIIIEAMNYSLKAGGKRLRPMLIMETAKLFKDDVTNAYPFMAAIEMIHTYSLVHDVYLQWIMMNIVVAKKLHMRSMARIWVY